MAKKDKQQAYTRIGTLTPEELFPYIGPAPKRGKLRHEFFGHTAGVCSHRLQLFKEKGCTCVSCGLTGTFFSLEYHTNNNSSRPHFNLYAVNENGEEVLMTKDHIIPKSRGGRNSMDNYQVMCTDCNRKKGAKLLAAS